MQLSKSHLSILSLALATAALWANLWLESNQQDTPPITAQNNKPAVWQFTDTQMWRPQVVQKTNGESFADNNLYLHADKVISDNQEHIQIEKLNLVIYSPQQLNLMSSDRAEMTQQIIQLSQTQQPVQLQHWRNNTQNWRQEIQLSGTQFTYNEQQQTLRSDQAIELTQTDSQVLAGNLQADLATGTWRFGKGVIGQFTPSAQRE
ncbi:hypothetical protein THMIRHAS_06690 [Thiosulfatimonas sediminis]|uniref:LPS export ABC transporter periplasmic protein LptC n=1 Tax=Thiosulfatimonas sediminis TaxID=2675054 RepID=A0A6F8PT78_9GAMM|nr:LPS export ABC transporter periplasmic protein LptC [Thiosulfatimonas sediminis]BBP45296.1 hypothetical protein THMIRHAS_06690 [Thiosulfatimonas sediminis]